MANTLHDITPQQLVAQYSDRVFAIVMRLVGNRLDAEEVTQDIFLKILRKIRNFEGQSSLSTWIYRIAYNQAIDFLRSRKRLVENLQIDERVMQVGEDDSSVEEKEADYERLEAALRQIDSRDALLIDLYYWQRLTTDEIGDIVGMNRENVKTRLYRTRQLLAKIIKKSNKND